MIQVGGVWLPDGETHLVDWMRKMNRVVNGKLTYQHHKLEAALRYVKNWRAAVDVGAHCGLWSMHLVELFSIVHAFEPVQAHRDCFQKNVPFGLDRAPLYAVALGEEVGTIRIETAPTSSGDSRVAGAAKSGQPGAVPLRRLDEYELQDVDFMKLDCEGYELFALRGAEGTLVRCRPCVIVEQKPGRAEHFGLPRTGAVDYLQGLGAKLRAEMSGDYVLSWDE